MHTAKVVIKCEADKQMVKKSSLAMCFFFFLRPLFTFFSRFAQ